jgi:prophage regulatory protein
MTMEMKLVSNPVRMLRLPEVVRRTALSRSQIYRLIELGTFPRQVPLGERAAGWVEDEVDGWLRERIERSRKRQQAAASV